MKKTKTQKVLDHSHGKDINKTLNNIYYNIKNPAGYSSINKLYKESKKKHIDIDIYYV